MAAKERTGVEWVGGLVSMPAYVTGEGEPYRPEALFWMAAGGAVLGHEVGRPGELIGLAAASLQRSIERPMFGQPHAPRRVRVARPELAEALRTKHPTIEILCAPTPEIDSVLAAMRDKLHDDAGLRQRRSAVRLAPPDDVLAGLLELEHEGEEIAAEARAELEGELLRRFASSPEGEALPTVRSCHFIFDFAADNFGVTVATLSPAQLREILFEIIPEKVSVDASAARQIIDETRALYAFLKREFGLQQAEACLRVLAGDAVAKLEGALSDSSQFGMAKSLLMGGGDAGFDLDSKEGVEAWFQELQSEGLPPSVRLPAVGAAPPRPVDPVAAAKGENQGKAERKARKKNR